MIARTRSLLLAEYPYTAPADSPDPAKNVLHGHAGEPAPLNARPGGAEDLTMACGVLKPG